jgi:hypothetical protein
MVSVKSRLGSVVKTNRSEHDDRGATGENERSVSTKPVSTSRPTRGVFGANFINGYLGGGATKPTSRVSKEPAKKKPTQVSLKSGSLVQVVKRNNSSTGDLKSRLGSSSSSRRVSTGGMRCDEVDPPARKPNAMFSKSKLENFKLSVKNDPSSSGLLGIDLNNVSLKRRIPNDNVSHGNKKYGDLKRTVPNHSASDSDDSESEEIERPKRKISTKKKEDRALYKSALNDVLETKKKARTALESRKRASRQKVAEMDSDSSDEPSPKKKSRKSKQKKEESDEEEAFVPTRRPGERGKSAAKDELDSDEDSHSPIEGYRLQVTNLNASVSESDLVDLFCAIGAVRDSRLQSTGEAIVTFVKRAAAMAAITKYNGRELDGQKISVNPYRIMELPRKLPYQWRNEYPTKKPRVRQELVGEIHPSILLPAITGVTEGSESVIFTVKV